MFVCPKSPTGCIMASGYQVGYRAGCSVWKCPKVVAESSPKYSKTSENIRKKLVERHQFTIATLPVTRDLPIG